MTVETVAAPFTTPTEEKYFGDILAGCVVRSRKRFGSYVEPGDLHQEGWLWAFARPEKVREILDETDEKERSRRLINGILNALDVYGRTEKAYKVGYHPTDESFYSLGSLRELLPDAFADGEAPWATPVQEGVHVRATGDPAEGGGRQAALVDVRIALKALSQEDQSYLGTAYDLGLSHEECGQLWDLTADGARSRINRSLRRLQRELGGERPYDDPPEYTGGRAVTSNAAAIAATE